VSIQIARDVGDVNLRRSDEFIDMELDPFGWPTLKAKEYQIGKNSHTENRYVEDTTSESLFANVNRHVVQCFALQLEGGHSSCEAKRELKIWNFFRSKISC
jgi:hypothetical protein